jgi:ABC-type Fe3+ transport system substrate-binding protein
MRRYAFIVLFLLVLLAPLAARLMVTRGKATAAANENAALHLVVITPNNQDIRREFARAFSDWHREEFGQPVEIDYRTPGGSNDVVRLLATTYAAQRLSNGKLPPQDQARADIDVAWGGGDVTFDRDLKPLGVLQPIVLPDDPTLLATAFPDKALAGVKLYEETVDPGTKKPTPLWIGVCLSSFGIVYNPDVYATLGLSAPARWRDLADPRLSGWLALADPTHSGSAGVAYMMVLQRAMADAEEAYLAGHPGPLNKSAPDYQAAIAGGWHRGMGQLLLIAANARYFTDSATQPPNDVGNGDSAAGVAIDFYGRTTEQEIGSTRIRFVAPRAETAVTPDAVAILYGVKGERQVLARRFVQFMLTTRGQLLWIKKPGQAGGPVERALHRPPIRRDLYASGADRTGWSDSVNPFDESGGFNQRGEWMALFSDTRPLWAAAWIDARDSLRRSYLKIQAVKDDVRRSELLARLADLPVTMGQVAALRDKRKQLEASAADTDVWKAEQRQAWAQQFREHYAAVAARCGP